MGHEATRRLLNWIREVLQSQASGARSHHDWTRAENLALSTLRDPSLTIPEFGASARVFRMIRAKPRSHRSVLMQITALLTESWMDPTRLDSRVATAIVHLEKAGQALAEVRESGIAELVGMSASHFGRLLKRQTNLNFHGWAVQGRLRGATHELAEGKEHVSQIAFKWGWTALNHFDEQFKCLIGVNPTAFRKLLSFSA